MSNEDYVEAVTPIFCGALAEEHPAALFRIEAQPQFEVRALACKVLHLPAAGTPAGLVYRLVATFHPPAGQRIVSGELELRLRPPQGEQSTGRLLDIEPKTVLDPAPVAVTAKTEHILQLAPIPSAEYRRTVQDQRHFSVWHCQARGSVLSNGTVARWTFTEHPEQQAGIGHHQDLYIVLEGTEPPEFEVELRAQVVGRGLLDAVSKARWFLMGSAHTARQQRVFQLPPPQDLVARAWLLAQLHVPTLAPPAALPSEDEEQDDEGTLDVEA